MVRYRFLRSAAVALALYGGLGLFIGAAMLVVGTTTFGQIQALQATLENERVALVLSIRTVSSTLHDTAGATADFQRSIDSARGAADQASRLANDSAGALPHMGPHPSGHHIPGVLPQAGRSPPFVPSAAS